MAKRVLLAGIIGGIILFLWGGLYHDVLPFGLIGLKDLPNDQAIIAAMKPSIPQAGMYLFPATGLSPDASRAERAAKMKEVDAKAASGPQGVLIYRPVGVPLSPKMLATEASTNIIQALLVAFVLAQFGLRRFASRLGLAFVIGIIASITTNISLWNWYGFPTPWIMNQITYLILGYFLLGIVVAAIVKASAPRAVAAGA